MPPLGGGTFLLGPTTLLAAGGAAYLLDHLGWVVGGVIVLAGLVLGLPDLLRLSPRRIWAISGVCFAESIRRRVLWITPLAIIGILGVAQFLDPVDPADAIRQTTK